MKFKLQNNPNIERCPFSQNLEVYELKGIILKSGYLILAFMTVLLLFRSFMVAFSEGVVLATGLFAIVLIALLYEKRREWIKNLAKKTIKGTDFIKTDFFNFLSVVVGALICFTLSVNFDLGAVVASGLVGIIVALVLPKYGPPTYCGAFVGMSSVALLPNQAYILLAAVIAGAVFVASKAVFNGFGGKLGTIAWTGAVCAALLTGQNLLTDPAFNVSVLIVLYAVIGAVVTMVISLRFKHGPVMASGIVALTAGLLLPVIHPEVGGQLAVMVTCATYAGMSNYERVPNEAYMAIAALFAGLIFIFSQPFIQGGGGKLGTTAFGSVIAIRGMIEFLKIVKERKTQKSKSRKTEYES